MSGSETAGRSRSVPGGRYTNHVGHTLKEDERKLAVHNLQRENADTFVNLIEATQHEAKRCILAALYLNDGVTTYDGIEAFLDRHRSNIKKHVASLEDDGIVTKSGNPTFVSFTDTDIALLATDTLDLTDPL